MSLENKIRSLGGRQARILGHENYYKTAVLVPLVEYQGETCVLFEKRAASLSIQPGEICFPGGSMEPDDLRPQNTAIRETCEELGVSSSDIEIIADLDIMVSPFGVLVIPFLGYLNNIEKLYPNPSEVEKVLCVPVDYLMTHPPLEKALRISVHFPEDFPLDLIPNGKDYPFRGGILPQSFYKWDGEVIWGLTARILRHLLELLA